VKTSKARVWDARTVNVFLSRTLLWVTAASLGRCSLIFASPFSVISFSPSRLLDDGLEVRRGALPELIQVAAESRHPLGVELVQVPCPVFAMGNKPRVCEEGAVRGTGRSTPAKAIGCSG
jgi:hypothetical protein